MESSIIIVILLLIFATSFPSKYGDYSVSHAENYVAEAPNSVTIHTGLCIIQDRLLSNRSSYPRCMTNPTCFMSVLLLVCGDIHPCPGPRKAPVYKYPCGKCQKPVKSNQKGICCDVCDFWFHTRCINMSDNIYNAHIHQQELSWLCNSCAVPFMFSNSFFNESGSSHNDSSVSEDTDIDISQIYQDFINLRRKQPGKFLIAQININSLQYKHEELKVLLDNNLVDCLFISETKLNTSHMSSNFEVDNYKLYRKDNTHDNGGGLICYLRADIPSKEEVYDSYPCENLTIMAHINGVKWALIGTYRKPRISDKNITEKLDPIVDKCMNVTNNIIVTGDLNCNMLKNGNNAVRALCDDFNLVNVVTKPTCFKADPPTLLDVILVSGHNLVKKCEVVPCPLSDFHHFTCAVLDIQLPKIGHRQITYRSYKHFDEKKFNCDLEVAPFHAGECLDIDDHCYFVTTLYGQVLNEHAPIKNKVVRSKQCPYMNSEWKSAIFKKHQLYNTYWKCKTDYNWYQFRSQRNLCEKLKRKSVRNYMQEKCVNSKTEPKNFWNVVSPYFSNKSKSNDTIQLIEGDKSVILRTLLNFLTISTQRLLTTLGVILCILKISPTTLALHSLIHICKHRVLLMFLIFSQQQCQRLPKC